MTTISNKRYMDCNKNIVSSITKALDDAGKLLVNNKVTGYMLILNYDEEVQDNGQKELVKSYSLHTLGDIQSLLKNAEYGVARAALRVRQSLLNKDRRYH